MMKKYVILGIIVIIAICGIGSIIYINSFGEAEIVFSFVNNYDEERDIAFFIDKSGCMYKTTDPEFIELTVEPVIDRNIGVFLQNNPNYAEDEKYTFIGKIEEKEIKEKIKILKKIAIRNAETEYKDRADNVYHGQQMWYGYYLRNDKIQTVLLKGGGDWPLINKDSRAEELAEWLSDVLGLYDYKYKENNSPTIMDNFLLDPDEYPRK